MLVRCFVTHLDAMDTRGKKAWAQACHDMRCFENAVSKNFPFVLFWKRIPCRQLALFSWAQTASNDSQWEIV